MRALRHACRSQATPATRLYRDRHRDGAKLQGQSQFPRRCLTHPGEHEAGAGSSCRNCTYSTSCIGAQNPPNAGKSIIAFGFPSPDVDYSIARPARYIAGRLICAINVGAALRSGASRARGAPWRGPSIAGASDVPQPVPGAVALTDRCGGGHVAIVSRVEGSRVFVWNPSTRSRGWREVEYTNRHARYRVAGVP